MNKSLLILVVAFVICAVLSVAHGETGSHRVKRGHGGGGGGGGYGHGPGAGGGARGPVYFCGYVGKGEGSRYGGGYGRR